MDLVKKSSGLEVTTVDVHAAKKLLNQGHRYLDVRTEEEFKNGHTENALNIAYMFNTAQGRVKNPKFLGEVLAVCGKEDNLVVGCQSGVRSVYATTDLLEAGRNSSTYVIWEGDTLLGLATDPSQEAQLCGPLIICNDNNNNCISDVIYKSMGLHSNNSCLSSLEKRRDQSILN